MKKTTAFGGEILEDFLPWRESERAKGWISPYGKKDPKTKEGVLFMNIQLIPRIRMDKTRLEEIQRKYKSISTERLRKWIKINQLTQSWDWGKIPPIEEKRRIHGKKKKISFLKKLSIIQ